MGIGNGKLLFSPAIIHFITVSCLSDKMYNSSIRGDAVLQDPNFE